VSPDPAHLPVRRRSDADYLLQKEIAYCWGFCTLAAGITNAGRIIAYPSLSGRAVTDGRDLPQGGLLAWRPGSVVTASLR